MGPNFVYQICVNKYVHIIVDLVYLELYNIREQKSSHHELKKEERV